MKKTYILTFQIYRIILFLFLPLYIIAVFIVGTAGHNPNLKFLDFSFFGFIILTPIVLTIFKNTANNETVIKKTLNSSSIILVLIGILIFIFEILEQVKFYKKDNFTNGDVITTIILITLTFLSIILLIGLIKNKI
ncbi:hypothetical protein [uncultured Flavobacterium sp.]|uniref:hypothetical protein n=1 Tax=uncultured Flavobacterium sp. TaxID=165435 RepID=UPI0030EF6B53|tara:strand:+ start:130539 stop:130946 length:408 start_codon:yes stop_codon:yes gene_type:complete